MLQKYIKSFLWSVSLPLGLYANFMSSNDATWKYHFESYTDQGGILASNQAVPVHTLSSEILNSLLYSLPEGQRAHEAHPEYYPEPEPEIIMKDDGELFVTFHHEGAGYKNSLGYYTYDGDTNRARPTSLQEIKDNGVILFANSSYLNRGGDLVSGTTVSLGDLTTGTKVIFFIVSNGWKGASTGVRSSNDWVFSSWSPLNKEYDPNSTKTITDDKHVALLWKNIGPGNILLMGFEDILRTSNSCDHDFNDLLFSVSSSPMAAISDSVEIETGVSGFTSAPEERDTDEDGINDAFDQFPNDINRAYTSFYPNDQSNATLLYEDMWPGEGDYDMNDMSLAFSIQEIKNSNHEIKEINFTGEVQATGASYQNGFAVQINTPLTNIASITIKNGSEESYSIIDNAVADGTNTIINIFDDARDYIGEFANVRKDVAYVYGDSFTLNIVLNNNVLLSAPPYNPYLSINKALMSVENNESKFYEAIEVHLPNYLPTSLAPDEFFGTSDDTTNLSSSRTYLTELNKPWALLIPREFAHPKESENIQNAYLHFIDWVNSSGNTKRDWYIHDKINTKGRQYADESKIIVRP